MADMSLGVAFANMEGMVGVFRQFHFLKVTKEVESLHSGLSHRMFTPIGWLLGYMWEEGGYKSSER